MEYKLMKKERAALTTHYPRLSFDDTERRVTGVMDVVCDVGFTVNLVFSSRYPDDVPELHVRKEEIPWHADRHVYSDGTACLCVPSAYRRHWPPGSMLADFLSVLVRPYFEKQAYYKAHGSWPPGAERPHGAQGIIEAYEERLGMRDNPDAVMAFVHLIAQQHHPKGTISCPCGSGKILRECHTSLLARLREEIDPRHAMTERNFLRNWDASGRPES